MWLVMQTINEHKKLSKPPWHFKFCSYFPPSHTHEVFGKLRSDLLILHKLCVQSYHSYRLDWINHGEAQKTNSITIWTTEQKTMLSWFVRYGGHILAIIVSFATRNNLCSLTTTIALTFWQKNECDCASKVF